MKDRLKLGLGFPTKPVFTFAGFHRVSHFCRNPFRGHELRFCDALQRAANACTARVYSYGRRT